MKRLSTSGFPAFVLAMTLVFGGCMVGPDFTEPAPPALSEFAAASETDARAVAVDEALAWWAEFGDPQLVDLVERAVLGNLDLEVALARVSEARAGRRAAGARLLPTVNATANGGEQRASATGPGPLAGLAEAGLAELTNQIVTVNFDAAWELDLFGRVRRGREASQARLEATEEAWRAALLMVASETATAYVDLRGAERRLELARRNLELQQDSFDVIDARVESGIAAPIDRERSRAQLASLRAALAPQRAARVGALNRLAVLLGEVPGAIELEDAPVPVPPAAIATGLPVDLVERRPDLRRAELSLHAATADVGVAIGDRLPRLSIGGSRGFESAKVSDLIQSASRIWTLGPRIDLPIFNGGQLKANVEAARARVVAADAQYRQAVLRALEEVETTWVAVEESRLALEDLGEASRASAQASEYAAVLYDEGLRDLLVLLDARRVQTAADDARAVAEADLARGAIALYRALGGGWQELENRVSSAVSPNVAVGRKVQVEATERVGGEL